MGRELVVTWAGRHQRDSWDRLCEPYRQRISRSVPLREIPLKVRSGGDVERLRAEGRALLAAVASPCWKVALDRRGRMRSSEELAEWLQGKLFDWPHPIVFCLGSDLGLSAEVGDGSDEKLSLGPMTLPHELARLVLYEQIYRALCISSGIKYHRQPL